MTLSLPDPYIEMPIGEVREKDLREFAERAQRNFEALARSAMARAATDVLRLALAADRKLSFGSQGFTWNGTGVGVFQVVHSLGRVPAIVLTTDNSSVSASVYQAYGYGATEFTCRAVSVGAAPVNGTADSLAWLAIG